MIKHIVMFKLKKCEIPGDKIRASRSIKEKLEELPAFIPELKMMEVGINISTRDTAYDLVLVSEFDNEKDLETYRVHPKHVEVVDYILKHKDAAVVVDFEA
jgi:hypothetical protein